MPASSSTPRILYYALGGGLGHLTRAVALARQLYRLVPCQQRLLWNTGFPLAARELLKTEPDLHWDATAPSDSADDVGQRVAQIVEQWKPDMLVVDTFPRGIGGELTQVMPYQPIRHRVLLGRRLPLEYVQSYQLRDWVERYYHQIIIPGEASPWWKGRVGQQSSGSDHVLTPVKTDWVEPLLIRDAAELLNHEQAGAVCRLTERQSCVCIVATGSIAECRRMRQLAEALSERWQSDWPPLRLVLPPDVRPERSTSSPTQQHSTLMTITHQPWVECIRRVKLVIAMAGYHLFHEARQTKTPAIWLSGERKYDRHAERIAEFPSANSLPLHDTLGSADLGQLTQTLLAKIREQLTTIPAATPGDTLADNLADNSCAHARESIPYENGAAAAAQLLRQLLTAVNAN
ncbi:MAG: hypothetical protein ACKOUR_05370 [Planctomycetota bacterium]